MTPNPSDEDLRARHMWDPLPGTVHLRDLIKMLKDGVHALVNRFIIVSMILVVMVEALWIFPAMHWPFVFIAQPVKYVSMSSHVIESFG